MKGSKLDIPQVTQPMPRSPSPKPLPVMAASRSVTSKSSKAQSKTMVQQLLMEAKVGDLDAAEEIVNGMKADGVPISGSCCLAMLHACAKRGDVEKAERWS